MSSFTFKFAVLSKLEKIIRNQEIAMTAEQQGMSDLNDAVTNLTNETGAILADIATALQNEDPDAAVENAAQIVNQATANLKAGDPLTTPPAAS